MEYYLFLLNILSNKIIPNVDMLSIRIVNKIMSKSNITLINDIDNYCSNLRKIKFFE